MSFLFNTDICSARLRGDRKVLAKQTPEGVIHYGNRRFAEMLKMPVPPKAAIKVKIEEIYDIGKGGMKVA